MTVEGTTLSSRWRLLPRFFETILEAGRGLLERRRNGRTAAAGLAELCRQLLVHRGAASGLALAADITSGYAALPADERAVFLDFLNEELAPDGDAIVAAAEAYALERGFEALSALVKATEAPRRRLFKRLNMVPGGTQTMVAMREHVLDLLAVRPDLEPVEADLRDLLVSWFNRGFLVLDRIDWSSPASVLEKIIQYEAVHEIRSWDDLRNRLQDDRRCFAFFHMAIPDDPLIFVEIALTSGIATAIEPLIALDRALGDPRSADTAMFYSISNCQRGLQGVSFGPFLIKQVIEELRRDHPWIQCFATLSPVPGLRRWVEQETSSEHLPSGLAEDLMSVRSALQRPDDSGRALADLEEPLLRLCAHYLLEVRRDGQPADSVARFHLANGASLQALNWGADGSDVGLERSFGIMVNYVYDLKDIERNHEAYFEHEKIAASANVLRLLGRR